MRHIEVDEIGECDDPRHPCTVIERIRAPQWRHDIAEIGTRGNTSHARPVGIVASGAIAHVMWFTAYRIGSAGKLRHVTRAQSRQTLVARHSGTEKLDVSNDSLHLGRILR